MQKLTPTLQIQMSSRDDCYNSANSVQGLNLSKLFDENRGKKSTGALDRSHLFKWLGQWG